MIRMKQEQHQETTPITHILLNLRKETKEPVPQENRFESEIK